MRKDPSSLDDIESHTQPELSRRAAQQAGAQGSAWCCLVRSTVFRKPISWLFAPFVLETCMHGLARSRPRERRGAYETTCPVPSRIGPRKTAVSGLVGMPQGDSWSRSGGEDCPLVVQCPSKTSEPASYHDVVSARLSPRVLLSSLQRVSQLWKPTN